MAYPSLLLLGSNNEKGRQLEELTAALLKSGGYRLVTIREIGPGGEEIDVAAELETGRLGATIKQRAICECKAHRDPLNTTDWLKFLGKVYLEEARTAARVTGFLIALSGVNGNVAGQYTELRGLRKDIHLVTGEDLIEQVASLFCVCSIEESELQLRNYTTRKYLSMPMAYYQGRVCRIAIFEDGSFSILDNEAQPMSRSSASDLIPLVEDVAGIQPFVDLQEEAQEAIVQARSRQVLVSRLMLANGRQELNLLVAATEDLSTSSLSKALAEMQAQRLVSVSKANKVSLPTRRSNDYPERVAQLFLTLFTGSLLSNDVLGCAYYDSLINDELLEHALSVQGGLPLSREDQSIALRLMTLSPSALGSALTPQPMIYIHRTKSEMEVNDRIDRNDRDYFIRMLHQCLVRDFRQGEGFIQYFVDRRGLLEIETNQEIKVKSSKDLVLEDTLQERTRLGQAADELGGGYVIVLLLDDAPEPWGTWED